MAVSTTSGGGLWDKGPHEEKDRRHELGEASDDPHRAGWVPEEDRSQPGEPVKLGGTHLPAFAAIPAPPASTTPLAQEPPWEDPPFNLYKPTIMGNLTVLDDGSGNNLYGVITCRQLNAQVVSVGLQPSGDTSGVTDAANLSAAIAALASGGVITLGPGSFYISSQVTIPVQTVLGTTGGLGVSIQGAGSATVIYVVGGITGLYAHRSSGYGAQFGLAAQQTAIFLRDFVIDGTFATANAIGADVGDGWGFDVDLTVVNFSASGAIGLNLINRVFWSEKCHIRANLMNNATAVVIDTTNSGGAMRSHEYNDFTFYIFANAGQQGVTVQNGAYTSGGSLTIRGNFGTRNSAPLTTAVLAIQGQDGSGNYSGVSRCLVDIEVESNQGNTYGPSTVLFGSASNKMQLCTGSLLFQPFANWTASNVSGSAFSFIGCILGDASLEAANTLKWHSANTPAAPVNYKPANPAGTVSLTNVMMGLGSACTFTPGWSGSVTVTVTAQVSGTAAVNAVIGARYGTGLAPANAAADTGTRFGAAADYGNVHITASGQYQFVTFTDVLSLTAGTAYWLDLAIASGSGTVTVAPLNISMSLQESP